LKNSSLTKSQADLLHEHFTSLALSGVRTQEYREFIPLWRTVLNDKRFEGLLRAFRRHSHADALYNWWVPRLRPNYAVRNFLSTPPR
jgi:hypothetical protein